MRQDKRWVDNSSNAILHWNVEVNQQPDWASGQSVSASELHEPAQERRPISPDDNAPVDQGVQPVAHVQVMPRYTSGTGFQFDCVPAL